jgi:hypothetical protein
MTIRMQHLAGTLAMMGVLVALTAAPRPAPAQCGMMGGGSGHDHSGSESAAKAPAADKKLRQSIDRLLSDERGRELLAQALLDDRAFMQTFIARLLVIPEWNALAAERLAPSAPDRTAAGRPEATPTALYACPMHAEVTSATPGDCPKCGMKLERAAASTGK